MSPDIVLAATPSAYRAPASALPVVERRLHSRRGVVSLALALCLAGVLGVWLVYLGTVVRAEGINVNSKAPVYFLFALLAALGGLLIGTGLAISGLFQADRKRLFAWLGLIANGLSLAGLAAILLLAFLGTRNVH